MSPFLKQCFVALGVNLFVSQYGMVLGFTAYLLPALKASDSSIPADDTTGSWIVSIPITTMFLMNLLMPSLLYRCGRKVILAGGVACVTFTWFIVVVATSVTMIIIARILQGVVLCVGSVICPIMIGEYSSPRTRGPFLTMMSLFMSVGTFVTHLLGPFMHWRTIAIILTTTSLANLIIVLFIPESPSYLITKGKYGQATKSFVWLRGDKENEELQSMIEADTILKSQTETNYEIKSFVHFFKNIKNLLSKPEFKRPVVIMINLYTALQFTGVNILASYAVDITEIIIGTNVNNSVIMMTTQAQRILTTLCFVYINKKVKRKTVLCLTAGLIFLAYPTISLYTYGVSQQWYPRSMVLGILLMHIQMFSIAGFVSSVMMLGGEVFPLQYRSFSCVITIMTQSIVVFFMLKATPFMFKTMGLHWTYCLYDVVLLCSVLIGLIYLPETKDRTLQDIEDEFRGKNNEDGKEVLDPLNKNIEEEKILRKSPCLE